MYVTVLSYIFAVEIEYLSFSFNPNYLFNYTFDLIDRYLRR